MDLPWWTYQAVDAVEAFLAAGSPRRPGPGVRVRLRREHVWLARRCGLGGRGRARGRLGRAGPGAAGRRPPGCAAPRPSTCRPCRAPSEPLVASGAPSGRGLDFDGTTCTPSTTSRVSSTWSWSTAGPAPTSCCTCWTGCPGGLVLLDDAQRARYHAGGRQAAGAGLARPAHPWGHALPARPPRDGPAVARPRRARRVNPPPAERPPGGSSPDRSRACADGAVGAWSASACSCSGSSSSRGAGTRCRAALATIGWPAALAACC
jgi:hypothetical protein